MVQSFTPHLRVMPGDFSTRFITVNLFYPFALSLRGAFKFNRKNLFFMLNKLYFNLSMSTSLNSYSGAIRYMNCPVMYAKSYNDVNYIKVLLLRKLARYCIGQFKASDYSKCHTYSARITQSGFVYVYALNSIGQTVLQVSFWLTFAGFHKPANQPLSKTAVIISRSFIEPAGVQSVTKV